MKRMLGAVVFLSLVTACGTTVPSLGQQAAQSAGGGSGTNLGPTTNGSTSSSGANNPGTSAGLGTGTGTASGTVAGNSAAPPGTAPGSVGSSAVANLPGGGMGFGVTAKTINIGIDYSTYGDQVDAAAGFSGITQGDQRGEASAVVKDINQHGGIAGRQIHIVWHATDARNTAPRPTQDQEACYTFTRDNQSFAVVANGFTRTFVSCVTQRAIEVAGGDLSDWREADWATYPWLVDVDTLDVDSQMLGEVPMLIHQGYFSRWNTLTGQPGTAPVKIGVVAFDDTPWRESVRQSLLPTLAARGYRVAPQDVYLTFAPNDTSQQGQGVADIQNAELRMRNDGVTHVILIDTNGGITEFFSNYAYSQHYYPRYGINSANGLEALLGGSVQAAEFNGAEGLGWEPTIDLPGSYTGNNSVWSNPFSRHCLAVMRAAGENMTSTNAVSIALGYCTQLYFIRQVVNATAPDITQSAFMAQVDRLGYSVPSAVVQRTYFGPGHHDSVVWGYDMRYYPDCQCVHYASNSPVTIP